MGNEAFNAAQGLRQRKCPHRLDKALHKACVSRDLEAQHRSKSALLRLGDRMAGMGCKARIMHSPDGGMMSEKGNDRGRCPLLAFDTREQCSNAAQGKR